MSHYQPLPTTEDNGGLAYRNRRSGLLDSESKNVDGTTANDSTSKADQHPKFDSLFFKRLARLLRIAFSTTETPSQSSLSEKKSRPLSSSLSSAGVLYLGILISNIAYEIIVYFIGVALPRFYTILPQKDSAAFYKLVLWLCVLYFAVSAAKAITFYLCGLFALRVRAQLTRYLHSRFLSHGSLYKITRRLSLRFSTDNPDQRITQDIERFADMLRQILEDLALVPILIVLYAYYTAQVGGWIGVFEIVVAFSASAALCRVLLQPLVPLIFNRERLEGDFRFLHVRVRENAESVSFMRGEETEQERINKVFDSLLTIQLKILLWEIPLKGAVIGVDYGMALVCYVIVAIPIFAGMYDDLSPEEIGTLISKSLFYSLYLIYRFTIITKLSDKFTQLAGYTARVAQLEEALDPMEDEESGSDTNKTDEATHFLTDSSSSIAPPAFPADTIATHELTIVAPDGHLLINSLSVTIYPNADLVITGPSGSGKTALLRVLAGLWSPVRGTSSVPGTGVMYVPQTPYLIFGGSLKDQLAYPLDSNATNVSDEVVAAVLDASEIGYLVDRERRSRGLLSEVEAVRGGRDEEEGITDEDEGVSSTVGSGSSDGRSNVRWWGDTLSPGEKQRLSFARLLFHRPRFAFMDEPAAALGAAVEQRMLLRGRQHGITFVVVSHFSHDPGLKGDREGTFFERQLALDGSGGWTMREL
ncbi:ABC transporter transmembrane region 2-domain-containing protein [Cladochytrium replicatum]|nr:ABC transporter transmembrane region 2-domain-containing protein [Cladochytrium replicatum]